MNDRDKVVVITGAGGGLGSAMAKRFAEAGASLALLDIRLEAAQAVARELEPLCRQALALACDVTDPEQCRQAIEAALQHFGRIDVLINNAGITHRSAFGETEVHVFRKVMDVNFFGALYCTRFALRALHESRGQIIVISSVAGFAPLYGRSGYAASKHALHGLFDSLRTELRGSGVHVMLVCPGFTDTGIEHRALDADGSITRHPRSTTGRVARPDEVAEAVFHAARRRKRLVVLSRVGKLSYWITRFWPLLYDRLMTRQLRQELQRDS
ncbi:MAG: SDR family oxidoreductase [candidate division KSB1 bacterium]|nr:SDR family oxidoreductase [candidate division KSB1 bacterium]